MRFSLQWLQEWVDIDLKPQELTEKLAMAGFETEDLIQASEPFSGVVCGEICKKNLLDESADVFHYIARVSDGKECNAILAADLPIEDKVAFAPNGIKLNKGVVEQTILDGIATDGLICTHKDLGLSDNEDVMLLEDAVEAGADIFSALQLNDQILEFDITPNRGDCLSIQGFTRELSAILEKDVHAPSDNIKLIQKHSDTYPVKVMEEEACPNINTLVIYDVDNKVVLPNFITERLRRCGVRSVSPIVDITNYVMLEVGQPLHAYDLAKLNGNLQVRFAKKNESINLLDDSKVTLSKNTLVIADDDDAVAIAGVMGNKSTSVTRDTTSIVLEAAFFQSDVIIGKSREYGLTTDSAFRFERGVCPTLSAQALERVGSLLSSICGGKPGPIFEVANVEYLPQPKLIRFRPSRCYQILGEEISKDFIRSIFKRLGFTIMDDSNYWDIRVPAFRFDINAEIDLIEEVARLYGYDNIKQQNMSSSLVMPKTNYRNTLHDNIRNILKDNGYNEVISYSFVDPNIQEVLFPNIEALSLLNPISSQLSAMRVSLLPGLLQSFLHNQHRQVARVRLFEIGQCFINENSNVSHINKFAGVVHGAVLQEQWGVQAKQVDFFDVKNDLENILQSFSKIEDYSFLASKLPLLHPGQAADIIKGERAIGFIGKLHPSISKALDIKGEVFLYELSINGVVNPDTIKYKNASKYPSLRRDISFFVQKGVLSHEIIHEIKQIPCSFLQKMSIFDIYEDKGRPTEKSMALSLQLRHGNRTLVDSEVDTYLSQVIEKLQKKFNIEMRDDNGSTY